MNGFFGRVAKKGKQVRSSTRLVSTLMPTNINLLGDN